MTTKLIGTRVEEYHILSQLGEGGISTIYLALDTRLQQYTVIKIIDAGLANDPDNFARFKREAQAVIGLDHPNIVPFYGYGHTGDIFYMAMHYIEGIDLRIALQSYHQKNELIPSADAVRIIKEVCAALDFCHKNGVLHRDVRPSHIMLNRKGQAILSGFGLPLLSEAETQGNALGTSPYMAPEQIQSPSDVGPQADLYAVGMLMYEMFTGELRLDKIENPTEMLARLHNTPLPQPDSRQTDLGSELETVILTALASKPAVRYQSGAELVAALEKSLPDFAVAKKEEAAIGVSLISVEESEVIGMSAQPTVTPAVGLAEKAIHQDNLAPTTKEKQASLPVLPLAFGGCAVVVLLFALLLWGGLQFFQSQLQKQYIWLPLILQGESLDASDSAAFPAPSNTISPNPSESEELNEGQNRLLLQIATHKGDSFYLVNIGETAVLLSDLRFENGKNSFAGSEWGITSLAPGACVTVWKNKGRPQPPSVDCNEVGDRVERAGKEIFWKEPFNIIYEGILVTTCPDSGCDFFVPQ